MLHDPSLGRTHGVTPESPFWLSPAEPSLQLVEILTAPMILEVNYLLRKSNRIHYNNGQMVKNLFRTSQRSLLQRSFFVCTNMLTLIIFHYNILLGENPQKMEFFKLPTHFTNVNCHLN